MDLDCIRHKVCECLIYSFFCRVISWYAILSKFELGIYVYFSAEVLYWCKYSAFWWNPIILWLHGEEREREREHWLLSPSVVVILLYLHLKIVSVADCSNQNLIQDDVNSAGLNSIIICKLLTPKWWRDLLSLCMCIWIVTSKCL